MLWVCIFTVGVYFHYVCFGFYFLKPRVIRSLLPGEITSTGRSTQAKDHQKLPLKNIIEKNTENIIQVGEISFALDVETMNND